MIFLLKSILHKVLKDESAVNYKSRSINYSHFASSLFTDKYFFHFSFLMDDRWKMLKKNYEYFLVGLNEQKRSLKINQHFKIH